MAIKIMETTSLNRKILQHIRNIVVDNNEVYKIVFSNGNSNYSQKEVSINRNNLIYGKGKINFKINQVKDGSGILHPNTNYYYIENFWKNMIPESIYCFYKEGLFTAKKNKYNNVITWSQYKYGFNEFKNQINIFIGEHERNDYAMPGDIKFKGWYLNPEGTGTRIDTIDQVYNVLFINQNESPNIPEITLYACWELPMRTVTFQNIKRTCFKTKAVGYSLFKYDGTTIKGNAEKVENSKKTIKVLYNTSWSTIFKKISEVKYHTWVKGELDGTKYEQTLRNNYLQPFLGWCTINRATFNGKDNNWFDKNTAGGVIKNITLYPQFAPLLIFKKSELPKGCYFYDNKKRSAPTSVGGNYVLLFIDKYKNKLKELGWTWNVFNKFRNFSSPTQFVNDLATLGALSKNIYADTYYSSDKAVYINGLLDHIEWYEYNWSIDKNDTLTPNSNTSLSQGMFYSMTIVYTITKKFKRQL